MSDELVDFDEEIAKHKAEIADLQKRKVEFEKNSPDMQLAIYLHSKGCHHNHTDQCGWYYETGEGNDNWNGYEHARYLEIARNMLRDNSDLKHWTETMKELEFFGVNISI